MVTRALTTVSNGGAVPRTARDSVKRWLRYIEDEAPKQSTQDKQLVQAAQKGRIHPVAGKQKATGGRKQVARSYGDDDWRKMYKHVLEAPAPEAIVLHVIMDTGLRIADVLRIGYDTLVRGKREGMMHIEVKGGDMRPIAWEGAPDTWQRLLDALIAADDYAGMVAVMVCPHGDGDPESGKGAYQAVNRYLKTMCSELDVAGRHHIHRLRRTVAVHGLKETDNILDVQQLLGHKSVRSTETYLDEARPDDVATLQQKLKKKWQGD
jgi:integrase